jgi:predicted ATPase/class 3 adenylate cyclase
MSTCGDGGAPNDTRTFLFTDIEGSTRQWEESLEMHEHVEQHFDVLFRAVACGDGEVFATMGDGIAAAFTSAEAAVQAAIEAQRHMPSTGLEVRMGVHTGEVERSGDDFRGRAVNRAARVMTVGHGGQILASAVTAELVRSGPSPVGFVDLGTHRLRDLTEPEHLWQVVHPDLPRHFPPVRGLDTYANNLPAQRSTLVGRDADVARVIGLTQEHRIVTLTGVGGVGKTRLAVQAAADLLADYAAVWFVELASVADPDDVADAIALTMGLGTATDPLAAAAAVLSGEDTLLVVDNCEHVVDSAAAVIDALTAACANLSVIATSREALGIDGEHVVAVRSLDPATTAVELFRQRAVAAGAEQESLPGTMIEHVCRRLDGIPLAIELAAARAATLGVPAIVGALDDRFSLLGGGRRRAVDRHSTMRATIDWSYRLLDADEQRLFQWLAVFSNGFELDAAHAIADELGIEHAATEHVASLVHKSMVSPELQPHGVRYRMLETVRAFALEQLDEGGDRMAALTAHAEWITTITDLPYADPCNAAVERNAIRLEREADSWRDAAMLATQLRSGDLAARLCGPPVAFFLLGRHDLADFVRPLLELCGDDIRQRRAVLTALCVSAAGATAPAQLQSWADEMQQIEQVEPTGLGGLMQWLALAWRGDFETSVEVCVAASLDPRLLQGTRDMFVGIAALDHFSLTDATGDPHGLIDRALEVADRSDVALHRVTCWLGAAWGLAATEPDRSLRLVRRALHDIPNVPALTRLTLPGSASRLLTRLDPRVAAQGLLEQLETTASRRTFVDLIPVFYAATLLQRLGHPSAGSALATLTVSPIAPYLSMMDFVDLARRVSASNNPVSLSELETMVRSALADIVGTPEENLPAPALTSV